MRLNIAARSFLLVGLLAHLLSAADTPKAAPLLRLDDYRPGYMAAEEHCLLVLSDGRYHAERIVKKRNEPSEGAVSEGTLTAEDFERLRKILDTKDFAALATPSQKKLLVVEDLHMLDISVARGSAWQSVVYQNDAARKHDNVTLRPLLTWWKELERASRFSASATNRCSYQRE